MVHTFPISEANSSVKILTSTTPHIPACVQIEHSGHVDAVYNFGNAAFGGTVIQGPTMETNKAMMRLMENKFTHYRVTAQSVTAELIAPALTDQGTITAAQFRNTRITTSRFEVVSESGTRRVRCGPDVWLFNSTPPSSEWLMGTSAYTAKAREGVYLPLKLDKLKWVDSKDLYLPFVDTDDVPGYDDYSTELNTGLIYPFFENRAAATGEGDLCRHFKPSSMNAGFVEFAGLAANVAIRIRVRQILEISCRPGTTYAPMLEAPLPPDEVALRMYHEVAGRMADGYPASYNDLGFLKNIISGIANKVLPFVEPAIDALSKLPGPIGTIVNGVKTVAPIAKDIWDSAKAKTAAEKLERKEKKKAGKK